MRALDLGGGRLRSHRPGAVLLDLDRGAGGEDGGGDDAGDRLGAERPADRAGGSAAAERSANAADRAGGSRGAAGGRARGAATAGSGAGEPELGGDEALQRQQWPDREERGQRLAAAA